MRPSFIISSLLIFSTLLSISVNSQAEDYNKNIDVHFLSNNLAIVGHNVNLFGLSKIQYKEFLALKKEQEQELLKIRKEKIQTIKFYNRRLLQILDQGQIDKINSINQTQQASFIKFIRNRQLYGKEKKTPAN